MRETASRYLRRSSSSDTWAVALDPPGGVDDLGVAKLAQSLPLDEPDPLSGQTHDLADIAQTHGVPVAQAVPERDDATLTRVQDVHYGLSDLVAEHRVLHGVERAELLGLLEQVSQLRVLTDRSLEGHRLPPFGLEQPLDLLDRQGQRLGQLLRCGVPSVLLAVLHIGAAQLPDLVVHVDGETDLPPAVGDGTGDGLPDPPRCICGELESSAPVEQLDGPHQPDVALLDQVEEGKALALVLPGDGHDQAQIGTDEPLPGLPAPAYGFLGLADGRLGPG